MFDCISLQMVSKNRHPLRFGGKKVLYFAVLRKQKNGAVPPRTRFGIRVYSPKNTTSFAKHLIVFMENVGILLTTTDICSTKLNTSVLKRGYLWIKHKPHRKRTSPTTAESGWPSRPSCWPSWG